MTLASDSKIQEANLKAVLLTLEALDSIRRDGGFGTLHIEVQNGLAVHAEITRKLQLESRK